MSYEELLARGDAGARRPGPDPNAVKLVLYTSGTTGTPKGVLHSHNTIMSEIDAVTRYWGIDERDVVLMPSPVTHITGYLYALELAFAAGVEGRADGALECRRGGGPDRPPRRELQRRRDTRS